MVFRANFLRFSGKKIGIFVRRSVNYSYNIGELSSILRQGIITLIPRENKSRQKISNYSPICLLNTVYKKASASIANRIKTVIDKLISRDQSGFISGRYIGDNTRIVYDLMQFVDEKNIPGLLLLIDFETAYDSLSWSFMKNVLKSFNLAPSIIKWISIFYNKTQVAINQGDPISQYLFILCAEILAIIIKNNKKIKGIKINNKEFILTQYADGTSVILDGSEESLNETLNELENYAKYSGLKVNFAKTHVVWIGSKKYSTDSIKTKWKLNWRVNRFKLLGITFDTDLDKMLTLNFTDKIAKLT